MTVNSHYNEKNILKRISRSNLSSVNNSNSSSSILSTKPNENVGGINSTTSSTSFTTNVPTETSLTSGMTTLGYHNKNINEVDTFQNTLPDQSMILYFFFLFILIITIICF